MRERGGTTSVNCVKSGLVPILSVQAPLILKFLIRMQKRGPGMNQGRRVEKVSSPFRYIVQYFDLPAGRLNQFLDNLADGRSTKGPASTRFAEGESGLLD